MNTLPKWIAETDARKQAAVAKLWPTHKHTPGPWSIKQADGATHKVFGGPYIVDNTGNEIAWPGFRVAGTNAADNANARLIAAAPAMLEALRDIELQMTGHPEVCTGNSRVHYSYMKARAAIAYATEE